MREANNLEERAKNSEKRVRTQKRERKRKTRWNSGAAGRFKVVGW